MGFRFRKRIKMGPGMYLNLTQKGFSSASYGQPGAILNVNNKGKTRVTGGIPGTGISYVSSSGAGRRRKRSSSAASESGGGFGYGVFVGFVLGIVVMGFLF